jgi:autotransporter-associated beta strand protein
MTMDTNGFAVGIKSVLAGANGAGVSSVTLSGTGTNYIGAPLVQLVGGGGIGATAVAVFNEVTGQVTGITVTNPGTGYTSAPTVLLTGGAGSPLSATATIAANATDGGLTKVGLGTLSLGATNTYVGGTRVLQGGLTLDFTAIAPAQNAGVNVENGGYAFAPIDNILSAAGTLTLNATPVTILGRETQFNTQTLAGLGLNLNLAPVVDLDAHPDNPIIKGKKRSFAADPDVVARHAAEFVRAHRALGVVACAKHFPGHGSAKGDTHLGLVDVTATWHERELVPFRRLIEAGLCDMIMSAHVFNAKLDSQRPATLSKKVITGMLREQLGFNGVITSDDMEMKAISSQYGLENSVPAAIEAGIDVLCFGNNLSYDVDIAPKAIAIIERAVKSGRISEARITESYERVLALKRKAGLIA